MGGLKKRVEVGDNAVLQLPLFIIRVISHVIITLTLFLYLITYTVEVLRV